MRRYLIALLAALAVVFAVQAQTTNTIFLPVLADSRLTLTLTPTTLVVTATLTPSSTATATAIGVGTATATATQTMTPSATATQTMTPSATATQTMTASPTLEPVFGTCETDPSPGSAPNSPVRIVTVFKSDNPEVVRLENVSTGPVNLNGWQICSITGNQTHGFVFDIDYILAPDESRDVPHQGLNPIWNNDSRDDAALYDNAGRLISYRIDQ